MDKKIKEMVIFISDIADAGGFIGTAAKDLIMSLSNGKIERCEVCNCHIIIGFCKCSCA